MIGFHRTRRLLILVALSLVGFARMALANEPATPQRPSFSADPNTTAAGTIEVELGWAFDHADQLDTPITIKLGAGERSELFFGWSPLRRVADDQGKRRSGPGDLVVGTRYRFRDAGEASPSAAFQLAAKLPTANDADDLGSGEIDVFLAGTLLQSWAGGTALVGYYQLGVLGEPASTAVDVEHAIAVAVAHPLIAQLGAFGELTAVLNADQDSNAIFSTLGLGFAARPSLVLDVAVAAGVSEDAPDWQLALGATLNLGRLVPGD